MGARGRVVQASAGAKLVEKRGASSGGCPCGLAAEGSGEVDESSEGAAREKKRGGDAGGRSCEGGQWTREGRYVV